MKSWPARPSEVAYLFNPAFCGLLLREAVEGYTSVTPAGMPFALAFLVLPVVLHGPTRLQLPRSTATSLHAWLQDKPEMRVGFAERVRELSTSAREAVLFLGTTGTVTFTNNSALRIGTKLSAGTASLLKRSEEVKRCIQKARLVGKLFAEAGETATVFQMWGVCP